LAKLLDEDPGGLFLAEDLEELLSERSALSLLRSACWGQEDEDGVMVCPVPYSTGHPDWSFDFEFSGGLLMTINSVPDDYPELKALRTRIDVYHPEPEREELFALGHRIALKGYKDVVPALEVEIGDFWKRYWPAGRSPDLRRLPRIDRKVSGIRKRGLKTSWQDTLVRMIHEGTGRPTAPKRAKIARDLRDKYRGDLAQILPEWTRQTGCASKQYYYNSLRD
jgi:hypothetical protein